MADLFTAQLESWKQKATSWYTQLQSSQDNITKSQEAMKTAESNVPWYLNASRLFAWLPVPAPQMGISIQAASVLGAITGQRKNILTPGEAVELSKFSQIRDDYISGYLKSQGLSTPVEETVKFNTAVKEYGRANWFADFYSVAPAAVQMGAIKNFDDYAKLMQSTGEGIITPEDKAEAERTIAALVVKSPVRTSSTAEEGLPEFLKTSPDEAAIRNWLMQGAQREPVRMASLTSLSVAEVIKGFTGGALTTTTAIPGNKTPEDVLALMSSMEVTPEQAAEAASFYNQVKVYSEAAKKNEDKIRDILSGADEWKLPEISFTERLLFTIQQPSAAFADFMKPYTENVIYPLAGMLTHQLQQLGAVDKREAEYDTLSTKYGYWAAQGEMYKNWDANWGVKLAVEMIADPLNALIFIPGVGIIPLVGKGLQAAGKASKVASITRTGLRMVAFDRWMFKTLDIPFDAGRGLLARIPKTWSQETRVALERVDQLLASETVGRTGNITSMLDHEELYKTAKAAKDTFAKNPKGTGHLTELGSHLSEVTRARDSDLILWCKKYGGTVPSDIAGKVDDSTVDAVNDIIKDTALGVGGTDSGIIQAKKLAIVFGLDDTPEMLGKIAKDIQAYISRHSVNLDAARMVGKTASTNKSGQFISHIQGQYRKIYESQAADRVAGSKQLQGIVAALQRGVSKIENNTVRLTIDRYLVKPAAEAYLGSMAYPLWNAFEGVFISLIEGVLPRPAKAEALLHLHVDIPGLDPNLRALMMKLTTGGVSDVASLTSRRTFARGTIIGAEERPHWLLDKFPESFKFMGKEYKLPKAIAGKDWLGWIGGAKYLELSDTLGSAVKLNFFTRKMAGYLTEYSYDVLGHDINAVGRRLLGVPPHISNTSLGINFDELLKSEFAWRFLTGDSRNITAMKELFTNGYLTQAAQKSIIKNATYLSPDAKDFAYEIIEKNGVLGVGRVIPRTFDVDTVRFFGDLKIELTAKGMAKELGAVEAIEGIIKKEIGKFPPNISSLLSEVKFTPLGKYVEGKPTTFAVYNRGILALNSDLPEQMLLDNLPMTVAHEFFHGTIRDLVRSGDTGILKEYARVKGLKLPSDAQLKRGLTANQATKDFLDTVSEDFGKYIYSPEELKVPAVAKAVPATMMTREVFDAEVSKLVQDNPGKQLWYHGGPSGIPLDDFNSGTLSKNSYEAWNVARKHDGSVYVFDSEKGLGPYMGATQGNPDYRLFAGKENAVAIREIKLSELGKAVPPEVPETVHDIFSHFFPKQPTDSITEFTRHLADLSIQQVLDRPNTLPGSYSWLADELTKIPIENSSDAIKLLQYYLVAEETASNLPRALLSRYFEEAAKLTKKDAIRKFWTAGRLDLQTKMVDIDGSMEKIRSRLLSTSHVLTDEQSTALSSLLERKGARDTLKTDYLSRDGKLLDEFFVGKHTPEEHTALRAQRSLMYDEFQQADAVLGAKNFLTRKDFAKLYYGLPELDRKSVNVMGRPISANDIAQAMGCNVDGLSTGIAENVALQGRHYFNEFIIQSVNEYPKKYIGFTKEKVNEAYDNICRSLHLNPDADSHEAERILQQIEDIRLKLVELKLTRILTPDEENAVFSWIDNAAEGMKKTFSQPVEGKVTIKAEWDRLSQEASKQAHIDYYKAFADYTNENIVNAVMKMVFPFWTYHTYRWFFLSRTLLRHPGLATAWGRYLNYSDGGYVPIPGTDIELNPFVGSVMGTSFGLARHDFKSYYENTGIIGEGIDFWQRYGFFPGAHIMLPVVLSPILSGRPPELGGALPAFYTSGLSLLIASNIPGVRDSAQWLQDKIFHSNFADYYTASVLSTKQAEAGGTLIGGQTGVDLWFKIQRKEKLTPEEADLWEVARRQSSWYGLVRAQFPQFRIKPEEYSQAYEKISQIFEQQFGMSEEYQKDLWRHNLRPTDMIGGMTPELRASMDEVWQWKIYLGRGAIVAPPAMSDLQNRISEYWDRVRTFQKNRISISEPGHYTSQTDIDAGFLTPTGPLHFDGREWRNQSSSTWQSYTDMVNGLKTDPRFAATMEAITPEGQVELARQQGFSPPVRGPLDEAIDLYFSIELKKTTDKYTGEEDFDYFGFWLNREAVRQALTPDQLASFDSYIRKYETPMEKLYRQVSDKYFRGYRSVSRILITGYTPDQQAAIAEYYSSSVSLSRKEEIRKLAAPSGRALISDWEGGLTDARTKLRLSSYMLDFWLYVFGYTTTIKTPEARALANSFDSNRSMILDYMVQ